MKRCSSLFRNLLIQASARSRHHSSQPVGPGTRTWNILSSEVKSYLGGKPLDYHPEHADVVIIGGGILGSSIAYWLKTRAGKGLSVLVLDKDLTYQHSRQDLSVCGLSQHFSLPENIYLSLNSAEFLRNIDKHFEYDVDIKYNPNGYLVLASDEYADKLEYNIKIQRENSVKNEMLTPDMIKARFPWINVSDVKLGCIGHELEGQFSSWSLLQAFVKKSQELGASYLESEVVGFEKELQRDMLMEGITPGTYKKLNKLKYRTPDNEEHSLKFAICILCAGHESTSLANKLDIGSGQGIFSIPLPVQKKNYALFSMDDRDKHLKLDTPLVMDSSGLWLRRNGYGNSIKYGNIPLSTLDCPDPNSEEYYNVVIKPALQNRYPYFSDYKTSSNGFEWHDHNTYDDSGILGPHPYHTNLILVTGFGNLTYQHAPILGKAVMELIIDANYTTVNMIRFGFDRLLTARPVVELNMY